MMAGKRERLFLLLLWIAFSNLLGSESREARYIHFTAKSRHDIYLRDLEREEVKLSIDGTPVEIRFFGRDNVDTAFALILENSPRTAQYGVSMPQWGRVNAIDQVRYFLVQDFFGPLVEQGEVLLAEFFKEITIIQEFTDRGDLLINATHAMTPNSVGIVFNNIEVGRIIGRGVDLLKAQQARRKILILFTATIDRESYPNLEEYKGMLRQSDIELYVVSFAPRFGHTLDAPFEVKNNVYFFRELTKETAGELFVTGEYAYLDEVFTELSGHLRNHYTVGFYVEPSGQREEHQVQVTIDRNKCKVFHRPVIVY